MAAQESGWTFWARPEVLGDLREAVLRPGASARTLDGGRGAVRTFESAEGTLVLRHYRRGGVIGRLLHDQYLVNRPQVEFAVWRACEEAALAVPKLAGIAWVRGGIWTRGCIATYFTEGQTLLDAVHADTTRATRFGEACGRVIRQMHDAGIWHADLQVKNILVQGDLAQLIDFDKAKQVDSLSRLQRWRNLYRLRRSCSKCGLPGELFVAVCAGYGDARGPVWLDLLYRLRRFG